MIIANLIKKERLRRHFNVVTAEGVFEIIYDGEGFGYEQILVNSEIVSRKQSYFWYIPKFDFYIGSAKAQVNVKVSLLLQISAFNLIIADRIVYSEEKRLDK